MIRGQLLRLWIKQSVHTGLAKVPHNVNVCERTLSDVVSQNVGLSGFLSCYSRPGRARWKLFCAKNLWSYCSVLLRAHIIYVFPTIQVFPAHWKAQIMESCKHLKKSMPCRNPETDVVLTGEDQLSCTLPVYPGHMQERGMWSRTV